MNILVVAPYFPPDDTVATLRIMSLCKYLRTNNHSIIVLTRKKEKRIPSCYCDKSYFVDENSIMSKTNFSCFMKKRSAYCNRFLSVIKKEKVDIVLITGGPFYTFKITKKARNLKIPCILDFRDPWVWDYREDAFSPKRIIARMIFYAMEREAINSATAVVTVTPGWVQKYQKHYKNKKNDIFLIENGYDDERLKSIIWPTECIEDTTRTTIGVFGKLFYYSDYYSNIFLSAINDYQHNNSKSNLQVIQIGDLEESTERLLRKNNIQSDFIKSTGFMNYEDGIVELSKAQAFLIIDSRIDALGTKLYDYLYLGKPILFVGPSNSAFASILKKYPKGFVCSDKNSVVRALSIIVDEKRDNTLLNLNHMNNNYSRSHKNKIWEELLTRYSKK